MEHFSNSDAIAVAKAEMNVWGLTDLGWIFKVDNAKRRHGQCSYVEKRLSVTRNRIEHDSKEEVIYTIRHEIAHALHFEEYVADGRREDFFARRWTGRKYVRKVAPHGAGWKRIALKVGVKKPAASSAGNAQRVAIQPWRMVRVNNGTVTDMETGYHRFPKRMSTRYMRTDKRGTLGKLFLVKKAEWIAYCAGRRTVNELSFYQDQNYAPVANGVQGLIV
jgi:hypothetical protein